MRNRTLQTTEKYLTKQNSIKRYRIVLNGTKQYQTARNRAVSVFNMTEITSSSLCRIVLSWLAISSIPGMHHIWHLLTSSLPDLVLSTCIWFPWFNSRDSSSAQPWLSEYNRFLKPVFIYILGRKSPGRPMWRCFRMSSSISVSFSVSLFCLFVSLSVCFSVSLPYLSICVSVQSLYLPVRVLVCLSVFLSLFLSLSLSLSLSLCLSQRSPFSI